MQQYISTKNRSKVCKTYLKITLWHSLELDNSQYSDFQKNIYTVQKSGKFWPDAIGQHNLVGISSCLETNKIFRSCNGQVKYHADSWVIILLRNNLQRFPKFNPWEKGDPAEIFWNYYMFYIFWGKPNILTDFRIKFQNISAGLPFSQGLHKFNCYLRICILFHFYLQAVNKVWQSIFKQLTNKKQCSFWHLYLVGSKQFQSKYIWLCICMYNISILL